MAVWADGRQLERRSAERRQRQHRDADPADHKTLEEFPAVDVRASVSLCHRENPTCGECGESSAIIPIKPGLPTGS
jgi:hypothetical protein